MNRIESNRLKTRINQNLATLGSGTERKLQSALTCLKQTLNLGYELEVEWIPNVDNRLSGEVKGDCIYVYDKEEDEALKTLRHEFLDYALSKIVEPYKQVTNKFIALINEEAYERKRS